MPELHVNALLTQAGVTSKLVLITPELAQEYLNRNTHNRSMKENSLKVLRDHMNSGTFESKNGQTIVFSDNGVLMDGQHRLQAIVDTGKSFEFILVEGVKESTFTTIDVGVKRKGRDVMQIEGIPHANGIAATVTFYLRFKNNLSTLTGGVQYHNIAYDEMMRIYNENADLFQNQFEFASKEAKHNRVLSPSQFAGLISYTALHSQYADRCRKEFWEPLLTGIDVSPQINSLRNRFIQILSMKGKNVTLNYRIAYVILTYNNHFTGRNIQRLLYDGEKLPSFL